MGSLRQQLLIAVGFGLALGLMVLVAGIFSLVPLGLALFWALTTRGRRSSVGGLLVGIGASWLVLIAIQQSRCASTATSSCSGPDLTPYILLGVAALVVGFALAISVLRSGGAVNGGHP
jgi:hypothetical protein